MLLNRQAVISARQRHNSVCRWVNVLVSSLGGELGAVGDAELGVDVRQVCLDGVATHEQVHCDLRVGAPAADLLDDSALGGGEACPAGRAVPAPAVGAEHVVNRVVEGEPLPIFEEGKVLSESAFNMKKWDLLSRA